MTEAQRDRIERSKRLVDTWLDATLSGDARRIPAAMAPLNAFIRTAPTDLASNVRLVGLIMALGRRCGERLPDVSPRIWGVGEGAHARPRPSAQVATRIMVAYANGDDDGAHNVLAEYVLTLDPSDVPVDLSEVFMTLTNIFLAVDYNCRLFAARRSFRVKRDHLSRRLAEMWANRPRAEAVTDRDTQ